MKERLKKLKTILKTSVLSRLSIIWNVKFRRGSKSLCTVYLRPGFVTAMVSVAPKDEEAAQMVLLTCTAETQAVYHRSAASKMGRWLMLDITSPEMLEDVKALLAVRVKPAE